MGDGFIEVPDGETLWRFEPAIVLLGYVVDV